MTPPVHADGQASIDWTVHGRSGSARFAPTGRRWEIDGADFHEYRDGRIGKLRVVCDVMSIARQLGVMPASGSRAERAMAAAQRGMVRVGQRSRHRSSAG